MKLKKNIPLIDQHDKNGFYANRKFGGNFVAVWDKFGVMGFGAGGFGQ